MVAPHVFYDPGTFSLRPLMLGAAIASLSYIGFDAISTLAEDTIRPERDISIATVLVCVIQTVFCVAIVYLAALVWPDWHSYPETETVILDIGTRGRRDVDDGLHHFHSARRRAWPVPLPARRARRGCCSAWDGMASSRAASSPMSTPAIRRRPAGIYLMGAVSLAGSLVMRFQLAVELLNFGAFVGFILVNLSVIRHFYYAEARASGVSLFTNLLFPLAGALVCSYVWLSLSWKAQIAGFCWLGLGALYLAVITRGFRVPPRELSSLSEAGLDAH